MTLPGVSSERSDAPPSRSIPIGYGTGFMAGLAKWGPVNEPFRITSLAGYVRRAFDRPSFGFLYDSLETFFREGGGECYIARVVGPAATRASFTFKTGANNSITVRAKYEGDEGNKIKAQWVVGDAAPERRLIITHDDRGQLQTSPSFATKLEAIAWAERSNWVVLESEAASAELPDAGASTSLAGGLDDRANVTDEILVDALGLFPRDLGPGQVAIPGHIGNVVQAGIAAHCIANNRRPVLDAEDDPNIDVAIAQADALRGLPDDAETMAGMFWPWDLIPGLTAASPPRVVPPCARVMGNIASLAAEGKTANVAAAGVRGDAKYVIGLSQPRLSEADRERANDAGVNVSLARWNVVTTYGWRTLADINADENWVDFGNAGLYMQISALLDSIGEGYVHEEIDGERRVFNRLKGDLVGALLPFWRPAGSLYGKTQDQAFLVDTGDEVNNNDTIQAKQINADVGLSMSPRGEMVRFRISKASLAEVNG